MVYFTKTTANQKKYLLPSDPLVADHMRLGRHFRELGRVDLFWQARNDEIAKLMHSSLGELYERI